MLSYIDCIFSYYYEYIYNEKIIHIYGGLLPRERAPRPPGDLVVLGLSSRRLDCGDIEGRRFL